MLLIDSQNVDVGAKISISVIIPVGNINDYFAQCVDSLLTQDRSQFEVIFIFNGTKKTSIIDNLSNLSGRINFKVFWTPHQIGAGAARNYGISVAIGEYVCFLDADDVLCDDKLSRQIEFMESRDLDFSYTDYKVKKNNKTDATFKRFVPELFVQNFIPYKCFIGTSTVMVKKKKIDTDLFPNLQMRQDWAAWIKLDAAGVKFSKFPFCGTIYNVNAGSLSYNKLRATRGTYLMFRYLGCSRAMAFLRTLTYSFLTILQRLRELAHVA